MIQYLKLGSLTRIRTGKLDANDANHGGKYPFFTCSKEPLSINTYSYDCECVLVAGNGDLNVKYYDGKFDAYQRTYIIESLDKTKLMVKYLYCFLDLYVETLRQQAIGGVIKYIKLGNLTDAIIPIPTIEKQYEIVEIFEKCNGTIAYRQQELELMDRLVKSRFIEMFGDSEYNTRNWPTAKLSSLCDVGSSKRIYQSELTDDGIPFLRISDLNERIDGVDNAPQLFIPTERFEELRKNGLVPSTGDILVTARGTLGRCYIIKATDDFYFQDGMISWLSDLSDSITSLYISELFATAGVQKQIANLQAGSTVAYLSIAMLKKLDIMLPPLTLQKQFADFVKQTDKSKFYIVQTQILIELLTRAIQHETKEVLL